MAVPKRSVREPPRPVPRPAVAPAPAAAAEPGPRLTVPLLLCALLAVYVLNFRLLGAGDSIPTRLLPFSVLREGNLNLDEFEWEHRSDGRLPYYVHQLGPHVYSVSTIATALVVTPLYILPAWWMAARGIGYDDVRARVVVVAMERISAALLTALSACLLYLVLRRLTTWRWALGLTLIYALGTSTWSIASQALWAHALSELCLVVLCAIFLTPAPSCLAFVAAGLTAAVMVANRPQMVVFAAPALLFVAVYHRRHLVEFAALPALVGALLVAYNRAVFSAAAGGYGGLDHFHGPLFEGLAGMVISPNRGLLIYTPIMLFAFWGAVRVWRVPVPPWLRWLTVGVALHVVVHAKFDEWWAGYTYGPRYFTDVLPALTIFLVYGLIPLCRARALQVLAVALALFGIGVQAIGVYAADDRWNRDPEPLELQPGRVWDWADLQIVRAWHDGWRAGELAPVIFDAFRHPLPPRLALLSEPELASAITTRGLPDAVHRGATARGVAAVTNRGPVTWPAFSGEGVLGARYLVFLLVRWLAHGQPVGKLGDVIPLPLNVSPGQTVEVPLALTAPPQPGDFELELRVTQAVERDRGLISKDTLRVPMRVQ